MFATYIYTGTNHVMSADNIFTTIALVNILRMPMAMLPFLIVASVQVPTVFRGATGILDVGKFVSAGLYFIHVGFE